VVTTNRVGAARTVEERQCGIVVAPNDPDALAQAIDAALDPAAPFAGNAQRLGVHFLQEFSAETIAQKIVAELSRAALI
jgi:glycosyltransferase involved in cell wall biosynthesis